MFLCGNRELLFGFFSFIEIGLLTECVCVARGHCSMYNISCLLRRSLYLASQMGIKPITITYWSMCVHRGKTSVQIYSTSVRWIPGTSHCLYN